MKRLCLVVCILALLFLISLLLYIFQPLGEQFYVIGDLLVSIASFLAFVFGLYAYKLHGFGSIQGKALFFLALGTFFWFFGEATWGIYEVALGIEAPVASVADMLWLTGYPFFLIGFYYVWRIASFPVSKKRLFLLAILIIAVCSFMLYIAMPTLTNPEISFGEKVSTAGYVIGDMLILDMLIIVVIHLFGGEFAKVWSIVILSIFMASVADIYYMFFLEAYEVGNLIDLFWILEYIVLGFGFFYHREAVKKVSDGLKKRLS